LDTWDGDWPPTLSEFRRACKDPSKSAQAQIYSHYELKARDRAEGRSSIEVMKKYLSMADPAPDRHSPEYIEWTNYHRRILKMPMIHEVRPDGSFLTAGSL